MGAKTSRSRRATQQNSAARRSRAAKSAPAPLLAPAPASAFASALTATLKPKRIFLLSPANAAGLRARMLSNENARFKLAVELRRAGLPLGEIFSFISGLYFRGKMAYANTFADAPRGMPGALVITACGGLLPVDTVVNLDLLREISSAPIHHADPRYRVPLERDAKALARAAGPHCEIVLLGSIATPKYVEPLLSIFGERLMFPIEFVGRGDMSRGGLLLRCARSGEQLEYVPVARAVRHGSRPPKLPKLPRAAKPSAPIDAA
jgi:hypothetical protein